jgi:hypothetical protein
VWRERLGLAEPLSNAEAVVAIIVTLAFAPFLQAVVASLGSKVDEALAVKAPEQLRRLLKKCDDATRAALNGRSFEYLLQVDGTNVKIALPNTENDRRVKAIIALAGYAI